MGLRASGASRLVPDIQGDTHMAQFTVIGKRRVFRVNAKSVQALTRALRSVGIVWQAIHEDKGAKA
ncbi:hypothetical protein PBI_DISMAS_60 [Microbacterium phage Dismas]|uniref:Uncharacterized protein n=2 Tax=Dismasvirus dismas TaxID=2560588 RepID=A0A2H5BFW0_9CAUD|nr:hypothetical protein FDJ24_gp60 [Microbacterium phage Dismas]AUG84857.1 hypothetical protein PBI_DISMAS_60 [Microbacterium phage Dismas]